MVANTSTGILSLGGMVRIDTLPEPLPHDIDDVGLRAASLARGEEAVAMIEADGWHLIDPSLTLKWGEAAASVEGGHGVGAGGEAHRGLLEGREADECVGELGGAVPGQAPASGQRGDPRCCFASDGAQFPRRRHPLCQA